MKFKCVCVYLENCRFLLNAKNGVLDHQILLLGHDPRAQTKGIFTSIFPIF